MLGILSFVFLADSSKKISPEDEITSILKVRENDHVKGGGEKAKIFIVEYGDFQCPACASFTPILKQLNDELGEDLQIVFRHFPLPQHENAFLASKAAEAAGAGDRFFEYHDLLFEKQADWADSREAKDIFVDYAKSLQLDEKRFLDDLNNNLLKRRIEGDVRDGRRIGVTGTPTFFVNGELLNLNNLANYEDFKKRVMEVSEKSVQESSDSAI